jgi:adenylate cyclase
MKKHYFKTLLVGITILVGFIGLRGYDPFFIEIARLKGLDFYQRNQKSIQSENIIIVEIDEKALEKYGQWPWKRDELSIGIAYAFEKGAAVVVIPIIFAEPDRLGGDKNFVKTLQEYPVITAQSASLKGKGNPVPRGVATINEGINNWVFNYPAAIGPTKEIGEASAGVGMLLTSPELDGVVRRLPLIIQINKELYPTIPLEVLRLFSGEQSYQAKLSEAGLDAVRVPQFSPIKTDAHGRVWLNFKYKFDSFSYSVSDWPSLEGKIVVFALTAEGLSNTVATPIGISQGYEVSMQALQMMIDNTRLERAAEYSLYEILFAIVIGVLLVISAAYFSYIVNAVLVVVALIAPYFIGWDLFNSQNLLFDYTWPTLAIFVSWVGALFMRFVMEFKLKQQIKKQFETYLSPDQVSQLQKNPDALKLGGEEKELSIMFTDVRGFTSISEYYGKNVQGLTQIMNRYMTAMTKNIIENKGTLDKYIGDAQMAFWNAPLHNKEHAIMAVATGLAMLKALKGFNEEISKEGVPAFGMGLGINTGTVVVGNMGSDQRFDYTCLGDHVNLASRLEGQSKPYGVKIVIGPKTQEYVKAIYPTAELDCIAVKGKKEGVNIYTVFEPNTIFSVNSHIVFLSLYRGRKWNEAIKLATSIIEIESTPLTDYYLMMIERIKFLKDNDPGESWDGVFRATSK